MNEDVTGIKRRFRKPKHTKNKSILNLRQNLRSKVFSARSSQSMINVINLSKTNDCECNSSSIISIGNQKAREIIRIWTKHA